MKNLKLLPLLGIAMCALFSFNYFNEITLVKDGSYKAFIDVDSNKDANGFSGGYLGQNVNVKIVDNVIKNISMVSHNKNHDKLIDQALRIDNKGNAIAKTTFFEQNIYNKRDLGHIYTYTLTIKKEDLTE